ncbi:MAG: nitroreductase family protein [bacterium]
MAEMMDVIKKRRSVRSFRDKKVSEDLIHKIIESACYAPSGINFQPWRFVSVTDPDVRDDFAQKALIYAWPFIERIKKEFPERYKMLRKSFETLQDPVFFHAPAIIFIIGTGKLSEIPCTFAAENCMLAAASLGLGTCWSDLGVLVSKDPKSSKLLELKKDEKLVAAVAVGYEEVETPAIPRKSTDISWI